MLGTTRGDSVPYEGAIVRDYVGQLKTTMRDYMGDVGTPLMGFWGT